MSSNVNKIRESVTVRNTGIQKGHLSWANGGLILNIDVRFFGPKP